MNFAVSTFIAAAVVSTLVVPHAYARNPIEAGTVEWRRDYEKELENSEITGRPLFLMFQEIPGCSGCRQFGGTVLSNPLLVEAIENEFIPVLVYNNRRSGKDAELLIQFNEPAWNYQVVRFLNANGEDIIPRKARVWTTEGIASRMIDTLKAAKRPVPLYLTAVAEEHGKEAHAELAYSMPCFWTGEYEIGKIDGVITTEAGWLDGHEVVRVVYNKNRLKPDELTKKAAQAHCARKTYVPESARSHNTPETIGVLDDRYRRAGAMDQKRQLIKWRDIYNAPNLTPMQMTKINSLAPDDRNKALEWLSPRQREALEKTE